MDIEKKISSPPTSEEPNADFSEDPTPVDSEAPSFIEPPKDTDDTDLEKCAKHTIPPGTSGEKELDLQNTQTRQDEPPPDGGTKAWLQVLGAHAIVMVTW